LRRSTRWPALGHINKVFFGFIPLALLVTRRGMDPARSCAWVWGVGPMLLLAFLQAPEQLVFAGIGCALLALCAAADTWFRPPAHPGARLAAGRRLASMGISVALCVLPLFLLITISAAQSGVAIVPQDEPSTFQPDLLEFAVPSVTGPYSVAHLFSWALPPGVKANIETAVSLTWVGVLLCLLGLLRDRRRAAVWLLLLLAAVALALGPTLRVAGDSWLTKQDIPLPYAALNGLPGLGAMRTPGRFMLLGYTAFAIAAAIGIDAARKWVRPKPALAILIILAVLISAEGWAAPYPAMQLPPVPPFYRQIAADSARYGVLDLPVRPLKINSFPAWHIFFSSFYQADQITHGKGIATGYVSRHYPVHPVFGHFISENFTRISPIQGDMTVDGRPSSRYANLRYYLAKNNYRYVVLHKPSAEHPIYKPGSWGEQASERLVRDTFGEESPLVDDEFTRVYEVGPPAPVETLKFSIAMMEPTAFQGWWHYREAAPGTSFLVHSPVPLVTTLGVTAGAMYASTQENDETSRREYAILTADSGNGTVTSSRPIAPQEEIRVPVALSPGSQVITLTLATSEGDAQPGTPLTMVIDRIDLSTQPDVDAHIPMQGAGTTPGDSAGNSTGHSAGDSTGGSTMLASYAGGWYAPEGGDDGAAPWRWAASPASLWIYSATAGPVTLQATPVALHVPGTNDGKGPAGTLEMTINGQATGTQPVTVGTPFAIPLVLDAGWNDVTLALQAGNFRPVDVQPETGDGRTLSFALAGLNISR
jgi:hypothetical protein